MHTASFLLLVSLLALPGPAQSTWYVDGSNPPPGSGTFDDPYASIQYAIDQATTLPGDTLRILPYLYRERIDLRGKSLSLIGEQGAEQTVLDGEGLGPVVRIEGWQDPSVRLEGLTIQNGLGLLDSFGDRYGGGIRCFGAALELLACSVRANEADFGGGLYVGGSSLLVQDCSIEENSCGGGILAEDSSLVLSSSSIRANDEQGCSFWYVATGLLAFGCTLTMVDCQVRDNQMTGDWNVGTGLDLNGCTSSVQDSEISGQHGAAGVYVAGGRLVVERTILDGNRNEFRGGAFCIAGSAAYPTRVKIVQSVLTRNASWDVYWGGAIYVASTNTNGALEIIESVIADSDAGGGGALWLGAGTAWIEDSLIAGGYVESRDYEGGFGGGICVQAGATAILTGCRFEDNVSGGGGYHDFEQGTWAWLSGRGGALYVDPEGTAIARRCTFVGNRAAGQDFSDLDIGGQGGAVYGPAYLESCTLLRNRSDPTGDQYPGEGGGAQDALLNSCILVESTPEALAGSSQAKWSLIEGTSGGSGNFDGDPRFYGPEHGDLHLLADSPCIDAGDPTLFDPDGSRLDAGAYAYDPDYCGEPGAYCSAKQSSAGCLPAIAWSGQPTLAGSDDFHLLATSLLPDQVALLLWSKTGPAATPFYGGLLCLAPPHRRLPPTQSSSGGPCEGTLDQHFSQALMSAYDLLPGDRLYFQWWYRDPAHQDGTGVGLTDALEVTLCAGEGTPPS